MTWVAHSAKFTTTRKVRICEDIVKLLQQKNLLLEYYGKRNIKVGEIEARVGYRMRLSRQLSNDASYLVRKLAMENEEGEEVVIILEREMVTLMALSDEMREFLTRALGNPGWERLVRARWLKKQQLN